MNLLKLLILISIIKFFFHLFINKKKLKNLYLQQK